MDRETLSELATKLLRMSGFTWAGNKKSKELSKKRMFEKLLGITQCNHGQGMSKKTGGIIAPRTRRK